MDYVRRDPSMMMYRSVSVVVRSCNLQGGSARVACLDHLDYLSPSEIFMYFIGGEDCILCFFRSISFKRSIHTTLIKSECLVFDCSHGALRATDHAKIPR